MFAAKIFNGRSTGAHISVFLLKPPTVVRTFLHTNQSNAYWLRSHSVGMRALSHFVDRLNDLLNAI